MNVHPGFFSGKEEKTVVLIPKDCGAHIPTLANV